MAKLFYQPVSPWFVGQKFGENRGCIDNATSTKVIACDGNNPPAGYRSVYSMMKGHNGLDARAFRWQACNAAREGTVVFIETEKERGLGVEIVHGPYDGKYYRTLYWHLIAIDVNVGEKVSTGQLVGYCDNTGYSAGDHLHFGIKECDANGNTLNHDNGFFGAIDPEPLMFDIPAVEVNKLRLVIESIAAALEALIDRMRVIKTGRT